MVPKRQNLPSCVPSVPAREKKGEKTTPTLTRELGRLQSIEEDANTTGFISLPNCDNHCTLYHLQLSKRQEEGKIAHLSREVRRSLEDELMAWHFDVDAELGNWCDEAFRSPQKSHTQLRIGRFLHLSNHDNLPLKSHFRDERQPHLLACTWLESSHIDDGFTQRTF